METRQLGQTGLVVSAVGLGCNNFGSRIDARAAAAVVHECLETGITFFDTAESYGRGASEEQLGAALGSRRDEAVIATKFGMRGSPSGAQPGSRHNVLRACEDSLRRLGTDYLDLYYLHRPDPATPIAETLDALHDLVHQGKVRYIASSNFAGWQVVEAHHLAAERGFERFAACQVEWSLLARDVERELVPACRHVGIGVIPFFPLASGLLTGKYRRGEPFPEGTRFATTPSLASVATDENFDRVERLAAVAEACGHTLLELALGWVLSHDVVPSVLVGATSPEQVAANAAASTWRLDADELAAVDEALSPR
jgi:aryl-alcohol dehydrogenase-like predicted oxidoreductase